MRSHAKAWLYPIKGVPEPICTTSVIPQDPVESITDALLKAYFFACSLYREPF